MNLNALRAVIGAEVRGIRRQVRFWIYALVLTFISGAVLINFTVLHSQFSGIAATLGSFGPRYLIAQVGFNSLIVILLGMTFLAFDFRTRELREQMVEVLYVRPFTNLEFVTGKVIGTTIMAWLPIVFVALVFQSVGTITQLAGLPIGDTVEWASLTGFLISTWVALFFWANLIVLLAMLVRFRILVAVTSIILIVGQYFVGFTLPVYAQHTLTLMPTFNFASELTPRLTPDHDDVRWLGHTCVAIAIMLLTSTLMDRRDDAKGRSRWITAAIVFGLGAGIFAGNTWLIFDERAARSERLAAHTAVKQTERPDIQSVTGDLSLSPGEISFDLNYAIAPMAEDSLIFTLNPDMVIETVALNGRPATWEHEYGLLTINAAPGTSHQLRIVGAGVPDPDFAYMDAVTSRDESDLTSVQIALLGTAGSLQRSRYIAMTPGAFWIPASGPAAPSDDATTHPYDFHSLDLVVSIPEGWTVAGPGRREEVGDGTYRFSPDAPVPYLALMAAPFERYAMDHEGITFEMLLSPGHTRNMDTFRDMSDVLKDALSERLANARSLGLDYPYDAFSIVEAPNELRIYAGGWRMDTIAPMPGLTLLRESAFPTARFNFSDRQLQDAEDQEGGVPGFKLRVMEKYFENDYSGGNVYDGFTRNIIQFQTSATGEGAPAINFLLDQLASRLLTGKRVYFSAHEFDQSINLILNILITNIGQDEQIGPALARVTTHKPSVWDRALGRPLAKLDLEDRPRQSLNALILKSDALARTIIDGLGDEETGRLLSEIVDRHRGQTFTYSDFQLVVKDTGVELDALTGDWLYDDQLPGFIFSEATMVRLDDDEAGAPRYQTSLHIRNDEDVPGLIRLRYRWGEEDQPLWDNSLPVRIEARSSVEFGLVTSTPLHELWTQPYLALNREDQRQELPVLNTEETVTDEAFSGFRSSTWDVPRDGSIIVDDLDPGFSLRHDLDYVNEPPMIGGGFLGGGIPIDMDQGIPEYQLNYGLVRYWSRSVYSDSYGKYRRTHALIHPGEGDRNAIFATHLPNAGRWQLALYLGASAGDGSALQRSYLGKYSLTLVQGGSRQDIEFDASVSAFGWNDLGEFQLDAGDIQLEIANVTDKTVVIADAVRWKPLP
ncbi:MAG: hypothetical protein AAF525_04950 [Pseudomonadota bacterium]